MSASAAEERLVVSLRGVRKRYEKHRDDAWVLRGIDLDVHAGEFVSLMGASGSGKSTLLNIIGGLDRDFDGEAHVDGQELKRLSDRRLSRFRNLTVGFVFQTFHLLPHLTCKANVALPADFNSRLTRAESDSRAREAMDRCAILHKADALPNRLSGGERQRVAIARALFARPSILLADEPTGSLDRRTGDHVIALFQELHRQERITVLLVTHEDRIARSADRIIRVDDGRVVEVEEV